MLFKAFLALLVLKSAVLGTKVLKTRLPAKPEVWHFTRAKIAQNQVAGQRENARIFAQNESFQFGKLHFGAFSA